MTQSPDPDRTGQQPVATHPTGELSDQDVLRELEQLYRTRLDTLRHGSDSALEHSDRRLAELEREYRRRKPQREVSSERLRPEDG